MDFITSLPKSKGKSVIMLLVYRLTKYAHFYKLSHSFIAIITFMEIEFQKIHGNPKIIVSDRDPIFTGITLDKIIFFSWCSIRS